MPVPAILFLGCILLIFAALDIIMVVSLLKPGDERSQIVVWKASAYALLATTGAQILTVIERFVRAQPLMSNPLIQLEVTAIVYFAALMYYKKKHGG